jgi:hypothetical protein
MRDKIKKIIRESLGVPEGITKSANLLYEHLIHMIKNTDKDISSDYSYDYEILDDFKIGDLRLNGVNVSVKCFEEPSLDSVDVYNFNVRTKGKIKGKNRPRIKYLSSSILEFQIQFAVPENNWSFEDIYKFFLDNKSYFVSSFSHEFKHSYDHYKRDTASIANTSDYSTFSSTRFGIKPFDEFLHLMYFTHFTENLVRPSEIAAAMESENVTRKQFLDFLTSNKTYQMLKKGQSFSVQNLKKELIEYLPRIEEIINSVGLSVPENDNEKIEIMLDIFWKSLTNAKISNLAKSLVSSPLEMLFGPKGAKLKYFEDYIKKVSRFKNGDSCFDYEEKFIRFNSNKMIKKISKLYDMAKINESIVNWELYHKINKTKITGFVNEIKSKYTHDDSEKLILAFNKIIKIKYPFLTSVEIEDMSDILDPHIHGNHYFLNIFSEKCLSTNEQEEIDSEFKQLFKLINPSKITSDFQIKEDTVRCFFDCGDGEGYNFSGSYGYLH